MVEFTLLLKINTQIRTAKHNYGMLYVCKTKKTTHESVVASKFQRL